MYCEHFLLVLNAPPEDLPGIYTNSVMVVDQEQFRKVLDARWPDTFWSWPANFRPGDWAEVERERYDNDLNKNVMDKLGWVVGLGLKHSNNV